MQHLLQREPNASSLVAALDAGAHVYVCGATAMGEDVLHTVIQIVAHKKGALCVCVWATFP